MTYLLVAFLWTGHGWLEHMSTYETLEHCEYARDHIGGNYVAYCVAKGA